MEFYILSIESFYTCAYAILPTLYFELTPNIDLNFPAYTLFVNLLLTYL